MGMVFTCVHMHKYNCGTRLFSRWKTSAFSNKVKTAIEHVLEPSLSVLYMVFLTLSAKHTPVIVFECSHVPSNVISASGGIISFNL